MDLLLNRNDPAVMHIDLNSCFATAEQQANPLLRGKPIAVSAYTTSNGCVISPSIEAKRLGIKVGMQVRQAKLICRDIIIRSPDPPKYRDIHTKFAKLFREYSPDVYPKSIDEAVIDFSKLSLSKKKLIEVGREIKLRMKKEIGEWISASIGIAVNRFLAKLAASFYKPDGLLMITHCNLNHIYSKCRLVDLCGINTRFEARLNTYGIFTPLDFLHASSDLLKCQVFRSIVGYHWYLRLRGWEMDDVEFTRKSYGQSYALERPTSDRDKLIRMLLKLCEKMGRRLRRNNFHAYGIHVSCLYKDGTHWHHGRTFQIPLYATQDLYLKAVWIFNQQPSVKIITHLSVSCFRLENFKPEQMEIFESVYTLRKKIAQAQDDINDRYGEYTMTPARMMGMKDVIIDRVAFGGVKEIEDLYGY
jgi:DNA polymerase-4